MFCKVLSSKGTTYDEKGYRDASNSTRWLLYYVRDRIALSLKETNMKSCKVSAGVLVVLACLMVGSVVQAQALCVLIAQDNSSVAIDTSPGQCVFVKTLAFTVGAIRDIRVDFDLGHSHGCCHHQSLDFRLNLDGQPLFQEQLPFTRGAPSGCANTQDRSATLSNVSAGTHTLDVFLCDEAQNCKLEVFECPPARSLDHFKCYEAEGDPVNQIVTLEDQFGVEPEVLVEEPELFCNPVDKNGEGIFDDTAHLTVYEIDEEEEEVERLVSITNQFGDQILIVGAPEFLFVPSEKNGVPSALNLDHFKCYEAEGDPVNVIVNLQDQFGVEPVVLVAEPELFCNPVDKNGEGILNPTAHLTCYEVDQEEEERVVIVANQFGDQILEVEDPEFLCVPSEKTEVVLLEPEDDDDSDDD